MKYKMVAIDMDGTLLNSLNEVTSRTKLAIEEAKKKGVHVVLSTGRVLRSALSYSEELNLNNPIVACNGAIIVDESKEAIFNKPIDKNLVKKIVNLAMTRNIYYHFYDESSFYSHVKVEEILKFYNEGSKATTIDFKIFKDIEEVINKEDFNVYKFIFIDDNIEKLINLRKDLDALGNIGTSSSWENNIEAMGAKVSKGEALNYLCTEYNIKADEVIAIGDSENDLSMIKFAGLGIAMGNSDDLIKSEADYITDTNDLDGVAKVIEKFILD